MDGKYFYLLGINKRKNKMKFKTLLATAITALTLSTSVAAVECPDFNDFQIQTMQKSFALGEKHDLGYTLAAIAFKESSAGLYTINAVSRDFGVYQGNVETICKQAGVWHNSFQCNLEIQRVVNDIELAAKYAIETLTYWKNYHKKNSEPYLVYEYAIKSYNAGFGFRKADALTYWEEYRAAFHQVKQCVKFEKASAT